MVRQVDFTKKQVEDWKENVEEIQDDINLYGADSTPEGDKAYMKLGEAFTWLLRLQKKYPKGLKEVV